VSRNTLVKDTEHAKARQMYSDGLTYNQIATQLCVAKSSVSLWCRDLARERLAAKTLASAEKKAKVKAERVVKAETSERKGKPASEPYLGFTAYEYSGEDGYVRIQLVNRETKTIVSLSRARYNMSISLGRVLGEDEIVRRQSSDPQDDRVENLKIVLKGAGRQPKVVMRVCKTCQSDFRATRDLRRYCSTECQVTAPKPVVAGPVLHDTECVICEKEFKARAGVDTCSKKCRGLLIKLLFREREKEEA
jgi:transposase